MYTLIAATLSIHCVRVIPTGIYSLYKKERKKLQKPTYRDIIIGNIYTTSNGFHTLTKALWQKVP